MWYYESEYWVRSNHYSEDTLIILDEIQKTPKVLESLNYFCEEAPEYHIVTACSLLGVAIHEGVSYPVGKVDLLDLYPLEVKAETNIRSQSLTAYCDKFHPKKAVCFSTLKYMDQEWMENIPLYAVCNL